MEQTGSGVISQTDLMTRLAQAKKVMNKVENVKGKPSKSRINEERARYSDDYDEPEFDMNQVQVYDQTERLAENMNVSQGYDINRINNSKLPDSIKKAMIERPIIQPNISLSDGIDMKIIQGAKRLMEQENPSAHKKQIQEQRPPQKPQISTNDLIKTLTPIMENIIRKVMDEKLNQLLAAQQTQTINENLVLKVGDSVFRGKITGVQSSK